MEALETVYRSERARVGHGTINIYKFRIDCELSNQCSANESIDSHSHSCYHLTSWLSTSFLQATSQHNMFSNPSLRWRNRSHPRVILTII